jgi:hypothetical protein
MNGNEATAAQRITFLEGELEKLPGDATQAERAVRCRDEDAFGRHQ